MGVHEPTEPIATNQKVTVRVRPTIDSERSTRNAILVLVLQYETKSSTISAASAPELDHNSDHNRDHNPARVEVGPDGSMEDDQKKKPRKTGLSEKLPDLDSNQD